MFFANWYLQALGAILGMIVYMYSYLFGRLTVIGSEAVLNANILNIVISYTLYPLCVLLILFSLLACLLHKRRKFIRKFSTLNKIISHVTVIFGLIGCSYYFIIPAILILYKDIVPILLEDDIKRKRRNYFKLHLSENLNRIYLNNQYNNLKVIFDNDKNEFIVSKIFSDENLFTLSYEESIALLKDNLSEEFVMSMLSIKPKQLKFIKYAIAKTIEKSEAEVC